ncbi:MAG: sulfite exporter TauE/SafE family protein [Gemmatimonadaceae bacterium]
MAISTGFAISAKDVLLFTLALIALAYLAVLGAALRSQRARPTAPGTATGFVTNFFDTLGIGSFAPTTSIIRQWRITSDELIPGTLNVGHTLPTVVQAFIFTRIVPVDSRTLILMIAAAIVGAWLGAGVVARLPRRWVQIGMGCCLVGAATIMLLSMAQLVPAGGTALALDGGRLALAVAGNFLLGALMTLGIGLYAPCMIMISLLGMSPTTAFPIMMGSCAFLMPVASVRFVRARCFDARLSLGLALGGIPAVLLAAFVVKALPLGAVRVLVVIVVVYTAVNLLRAAARAPLRTDDASPVVAT